MESIMEIVNSFLSNEDVNRFFEILLGILGSLYVFKIIVLNKESERHYKYGYKKEGYKQRVELRKLFLYSNIFVLIGSGDYRVWFVYMGIYILYEITDYLYRKRLEEAIEGDKSE